MHRQSSSPRDSRRRTVPIVTGIAGLAPTYDGFILDLWGTVHDGITPLPGALDALERLHKLGKRVLLLSNAPRRNYAVLDLIRKVGVPDGLYDAILSSGEAAYLALRDRRDPWHARLGRRCFLLGPANDASAMEDLDLDRATALADADFILGIGAFRRGDTLDMYDDFIAEAARHRLPMICANPDLVVLRGPVLELCAGGIAARYEVVGGDVYYHGKPHAPIYAMARERLGLGAGARILAVGDSLRTDIAGAEAAGLDSLFLTSGIYADELGVEPFTEPPADKVTALCAKHGHWPTAAASLFRW
ncbi:MAG TPA: TIGR01459 family HAD-type hydrolase [Alphaproteobacteria bacterium]|jgi:HAD superfamily hydrolase (TIGR01459 family)|nr:TIGR01459 family HAD-type hydrolase [Alphaproteobacteria bacterium]